MMKVCSSCKQEKEISFFGKNASAKDGYSHVCSSCRKEQSAAYYKQNKEKVLTRNKEWAVEQKDKQKEYLKQWYQKNKERILEEDKEWYLENRELALSRCKDWRDRNPGVVRERTSRRREAVKQATPTWLTEEDKQNIRNIYKQAEELERQTSIKYHVDHVIPLRAKAACGLHVPWNLQSIPAKYNLIKNNALTEAALAAALSA
jgi:hypothetical protein